MRNALIATVSTFLSHYFNARFLQSGWITEYRPDRKSAQDPELVVRRILEMKTRFLYCLREAARALDRYKGEFIALSAFEEDKLTEAFEIISTPERTFSDQLLNRCTEVMATDIGSVRLTEAICGQFLRRILQMVRQDVHDPEHIKYLYLFSAWKMPEVLFDAPVAAMVQRREVRALLTDARLPEDLLAALRAVRGYGIFRARGGDGGKPVDEGWDLDRARTAAEAVPKRRALHGLFGRLGRRSRPRTRRR